MADDFEAWAQEAERALLDDDTPNPRTGLIILRLLRRWHATVFMRHVEEEHENRERMERWLFAARATLAVLAALGGFVAWGLHTVVGVVSLLQAGAGGP